MKGANYVNSFQKQNCIFAYMKTAIRKIRESLSPIYDRREIDAMIKIIFEHLLNYSPVDIIVHGNDELSEFMQGKVDKVIARLIAYEPIQYIFNESYFHGHKFEVTEATLIPRPETEELVDLIIDENKASDLRVLDIGTGSGCIAISLARALRFARVSAIDISAEALDVARRNAKRMKCDIDFIEADILDYYDKSSEYDIIVSNPPYICNEEKTEMERNVLDFEPHSALFVPDNDPLLYYKAIAKFALERLDNGGKLYFEINSRFSADTVQMLLGTGFSDINIHKDIHNRDRFISATKKSDS